MKARLLTGFAVAAALAVTVLIPVSAQVLVPASAQVPTYDVTWFAGPPGAEQTYTGTATMTVDGKGVVTGKLGLTSPVAVNGALAGSVAKDVLTLDFPYEIPDQQCTGTIKGSAKVAAGLKTFEGTAMIGGACTGDEAFNSTFKFTLREK